MPLKLLLMMVVVEAIMAPSHREIDGSIAGKSVENIVRRIHRGCVPEVGILQYSIPVIFTIPATEPLVPEPLPRSIVAPLLMLVPPV